MKQLLAIILAVVVFATVCFPVFADGEQTVPQEGTSVDVPYTVSGGYTVVLPDCVLFGQESTAYATVRARDVEIEYGRKLVISVSSANTYKLKLDGSDISVPYFVRVESTKAILSSNQQIPILTVNSGYERGTERLIFSVDKPVSVAGAYKDTLTFLVFVE